MGDDQCRLIVNADDFGLSHLTNVGIMRCRTNGIVTSASLMVRAPAAREAVDLWRADRQMSLGLHLELGEWQYDGTEWKAIYEVVPTFCSDAVRDEIHRQLSAFRDLVGANPTHLDSHQHVHNGQIVGRELRRLADELGVVLRGCDSRVRFWGAFFGQNEAMTPMPGNISVEGLLALLKRLPSGTTEMSCHPGLDFTLNSHYRRERITEVQTLCHPRVRTRILQAGLKLISFANIPMPKAHLSISE